MNRTEKFWLLLMAITVFNVVIADSGQATLIITLIITLTTTYKGFVVIDRFMELQHGNIVLRRLMKLYFLIFPALIIITFIIPETIARWTSL